MAIQLRTWTEPHQGIPDGVVPANPEKCRLLVVGKTHLDHAGMRPPSSRAGIAALTPGGLESIYFSGNNRNEYVCNIPAIGTGDYTWHLHAHSPSGPGSFAYVVGTDLYIFSLAFNINNNQLSIYDGSTRASGYQVLAGNNIITVVRRSGTLYWYANGKQVGTPLANTTSISAISKFALNTYQTGQAFGDTHYQLLFAFAPWAWSDAEVLAIHANEGLLFAERDVVGYYEAGGGATTVTLTTSLSAAIQQSHSATASLGAAVRKEHTNTASIDAAIHRALSISGSLDSAVQQGHSATVGADAAIRKAFTLSAALDAAIQQAKSASASINAYVFAGGTLASASLDAALRYTRTITGSTDAAIRKAQTASASLDAALSTPGIATASLDAYIQAASVAILSLDAAVQTSRSVSVGLSAYISAGISLSNEDLDAIAARVWDTELATGYTAAQMMRIMFAALAGKRAGLGTATEHYMAVDGVTPRITFVPDDAAGNGTPTLNPD